jgi:hypothetical protein
MLPELAEVLDWNYASDRLAGLYKALPMLVSGGVFQKATDSRFGKERTCLGLCRSEKRFFRGRKYFSPAFLKT